MTELFAVRRKARGFLSPGFPLVTWTLLLHLSPGNLVLPRARSGWCCRAWWGVLSLLLREPASSSLHLSVPAASSALCCPPGPLGHSLFFWEWSTWKGQSGLPRPLCCNCKRLWRFFLCRWLLCRGRLARIIQQDLLVNTTRPVLCCHSLTPQRFPGFHLQFQCEHAEQHIGLQGCA